MYVLIVDIWIFVKQVTGPFVPSFAIRMYMAFIDTLRSQNTDLQTFKYFMHIIPTKVDPDNLRGCQICNDHINYNSQYHGLSFVTKGYY